MLSTLTLHLISDNKNLKQAVEHTGVDIREVFEEYEKSWIGMDDVRKLVKNGFKLVPESSIPEDQTFLIPLYPEDQFEILLKEGIVDEDDGAYFSAIHLLMQYLGYGIDGFAYEILNKSSDDYIIGHYADDAPVSSFGYGMFN